MSRALSDSLHPFYLSRYVYMFAGVPYVRLLHLPDTLFWFACLSACLDLSERTTWGTGRAAEGERTETANGKHKHTNIIKLLRCCCTKRGGTESITPLYSLPYLPKVKYGFSIFVCVSLSMLLGAEWLGSRVSAFRSPRTLPRNMPGNVMCDTRRILVVVTVCLHLYPLLLLCSRLHCTYMIGVCFMLFTCDTCLISFLSP